MYGGGFKVCPSCGQHAMLQETTCLQCGHVYRTQFAPPPDRTQAIPLTVQPPPFNRATVVDECTRQYHAYTLWRITSFFALLTGLLTVPGLIVLFILWRGEGDLRQKVASVGMDSEAWMRTVEPIRRRLYTQIAVVCACFCLFIVIAGVLMVFQYNRESRDHEERARAERVQVMDEVVQPSMQQEREDVWGPIRRAESLRRQQEAAQYRTLQRQQLQGQARLQSDWNNTLQRQAREQARQQEMVQEEWRAAQSREADQRRASGGFANGGLGGGR